MELFFGAYHSAFSNPVFWLYCVALVTDLILGNIRAWVTNDVDSSVGIKGSLKHFGLFTFVSVFLPMFSSYMGNSSISVGVVTYFIYQYLISIIENLAALGFNMPDGLTKKFRRLGETEYDLEFTDKKTNQTAEFKVTEKKENNDEN